LAFKDRGYFAFRVLRRGAPLFKDFCQPRLNAIKGIFIECFSRTTSPLIVGSHRCFYLMALQWMIIFDAGKQKSWRRVFRNLLGLATRMFRVNTAVLWSVTVTI
jgi:hypothetical protein